MAKWDLKGRRRESNQRGEGRERQPGKQGRDISTQLEAMCLDEWGRQRHWKNTGACSLLFVCIGEYVCEFKLVCILCMYRRVLNHYNCVSSFAVRVSA